MARGVPGGGAGWEDGRKGQESRAGMEALPNASSVCWSVRLSPALLGVVVQLPAEAPARRSLGLARPPSPLTPGPLRAPRPALTRCGLRAPAEADPQPGWARHRGCPRFLLLPAPYPKSPRWEMLFANGALRVRGRHPRLAPSAAKATVSPTGADLESGPGHFSLRVYGYAAKKAGAGPMISHTWQPRL